MKKLITFIFILLITQIYGKIELQEYTPLKVNMKEKVKIDISSTIKSISDMNKLEMEATLGKVYWDMEEESNELFSSELKDPKSGEIESSEY